MLKSMTGFGRCEVSNEKRKFTVEMKSVNHRYLDVSIKMPKKLNFFEAAIRNELKSYIQRGKVDIFITFEDLSEENVTIKYNKDIAEDTPDQRICPRHGYLGNSHCRSPFCCCTCVQPALCQKECQKDGTDQVSQIYKAPVFQHGLK